MNDNAVSLPTPTAKIGINRKLPAYTDASRNIPCVKSSITALPISPK